MCILRISVCLFLQSHLVWPRLTRCLSLQIGRKVDVVTIVDCLLQLSLTLRSAYSLHLPVTDFLPRSFCSGQKRIKLSCHHHHHHHHHHHVPEGLGVLSCSLILNMKLVPPPLPWSSRVPSSFWSIL